MATLEYRSAHPPDTRHTMSTRRPREAVEEDNPLEASPLREVFLEELAQQHTSTAPPTASPASHASTLQLPPGGAAYVTKCHMYADLPAYTPITKPLRPRLRRSWQSVVTTPRRSWRSVSKTLLRSCEGVLRVITATLRGAAVAATTVVTMGGAAACAAATAVAGATKILPVIVVPWGCVTLFYASRAITEVPAGRQCLEKTDGGSFLTSALIDTCACVSPELHDAYLEPLSFAIFSGLVPRELWPAAAAAN